MTLPPQPPGGPPGPDPSMEDILASIRRILNEDEPPPSVAGPATPQPPAALPEPDGVLVLDASMLVDQPPPEPKPMPEPTPPQPEAPAPTLANAAPASALVAPEAAAGVASSVSALMRTLASERSTAVQRGGPTIEDLVREEIRPLLKDWLDHHLPPIVERLVRAEIERVVGRSVP